MFRSVLCLTVSLCILPTLASAQAFDPYQIVGWTPWCLGFNPYDLKPGQPAPTDLTVYDPSRCASLDVIDQQTVTKLSLPEAVVGAPGSELAWLIIHQTDRAQIQNVLVQADGLSVPVRHVYALTLDTRRLSIPLHEWPEFKGKLATFSVLVSCSGGCSAQISMRDANNIWPHPTIVNGQTVATSH